MAEEIECDFKPQATTDTIELIKGFIAQKIEEELKSDLILFNCSIGKSSFIAFQDVFSQTSSKGKKNGHLSIILNTNGGDPDIVPYIVSQIRGSGVYTYVRFIVLQQAVSAGTLLCLSGNELYMSNASYLGSIDLQIKEIGKSWQFIKKHIDSMQSEMTQSIREKLFQEMAYDDNNAAEYNIKAMAKEYLFAYHAWEGITEEQKEKLLTIPDILTNNGLMKENSVENHNSPIFIKQAKQLGLRVINYENEHGSLYANVRKLYDVMIGEQYIKSMFKGQVSLNFIYSRHYKGYLYLRETEKIQTSTMHLESET